MLKQPYPIREIPTTLLIALYATLIIATMIAPQSNGQIELLPSFLICLGGLILFLVLTLSSTLIGLLGMGFLLRVRKFGMFNLQSSYSQGKQTDFPA